MALTFESLSLILIGLGLLFVVAIVVIVVLEVRKRAKIARGEPVQTVSRQVNLKQLEAMPATEVFTRMQKELRSWGITLIILGGLHLVANGLFNSQWGLVLLVVGAMSFFFNDAAMFAVYGVTLAWAGINNLLLPSSGAWALFSLLQFYFAYTTFRRFFVFRRAENEAIAPPAGSETPNSTEFTAADPFMTADTPPLTRSHRIFPWLTTVCAIIGIFGTVGFLAANFVLGAAGTDVPLILNFVGEFAFAASIFGMAVGLAASLSRFRPMMASLFGAIVSGLSLLIWVALLTIARLA